MDTDLRVIGPVLDNETGVQNYTVRLGDQAVEFGVIPRETRDGITEWVMRVGSDRVVPGDYSFEPYSNPEEAYEAGMRASRQILENA